MLKRFMCSFFLALLLDKVLSSYIYVSDSEEVFMSNAFLHCRERGGILLTNDEIDEYAEEIKDQCPDVKGIYWTGNYSTITPVLSLHGCYEYTNFSTGSAFHMSPNNSVAKCQARCFSENGIAIKGEVCQCLTIPQVNSFITANVEDCDIKRNGEIRGGENTMSVYIRQGEGDAVKPVCQYGNCVGRRSSVSTLCESQDKSRTVCSFEGIVKELGDTNEWWDAMQMCISNNSYLVSLDKFVANRDSLCPNNETLRIWTNRRQYMDTIILPGDGIRENYIHSENIVCQFVNMTSLTFVQTRQCNGNQQHGYLCKTNARPNVSNSCVVDLTQEQTDQTDQTTHLTREVLTTLSTGILSTSTSESSMLTNTTIAREPEDKTDTKSPADSTLVIIIGAAVGGGVVVLLAVGLVLFAVKRNSKKTKDGSVKFSELKKTEENGTQLLKGVDNQVFVTPVGESYEAAYDLAGDGEPKFDKSDTEYDMLRQNKNPGDDSTYDHTTNTYGMTSHATNDAVVYDSGDPSIYDRSRSNKKSMRGDDVYDKMESNIYDKTNTNGRDKSGDDIYDRGNDNVYDGTSVAKRGEIGDNIYDKTNDNVYDGTSVANRCETGDNIYDKTNENLYDKSSTSRSDQAGDNVYDKTNENVYD